MNTLTQRHRAQQLLLRRDTSVKVERLWPALQWDRLDETYPALAVRLAAVVQQNRRTSSGISAQYVRAFRRASRIPGKTRIEFPDSLPVEQFGATLHSTSVAPIKAAAGRGVVAEVAMANGLALVQGSMARLVLNAGRETVTQTIKADSAAKGYARVLGGGGCDFCQDLAGRGAVYSADAADFEAHDKCGCTAEPDYGN